jgi:gluconolactonase
VAAAQLASDLGFAEGPVVLPDGRLVLCDCNKADVWVYDEGSIERYGRTGGSPWGAALGSDGAIYLTQGGNVPGSGDTSATPGIQRVSEHGSAELLCSEVDGVTVAAPNDLAFGPDGRLYFTDSGTEQDDRVETPSPGRLFAISESDGEVLLDLPDVYPNGIAFDAERRLLWTESTSRRVRRLENGSATTICELPEGYVPDGMAVARDGRLFVCTTTSGGITVLSPDGEQLDQLELGEWPTNCAFAGSTLYATCVRTSEIEASERTGTLWRVETDATGLELIAGRLVR